jgi:hypothetical protein
MLAIAGTADRIESYTLRFGNAAQGLGQVPFRPRRRRPPDPARWLVTLADGGDPTVGAEPD